MRLGRSRAAAAAIAMACAATIAVVASTPLGFALRAAILAWLALSGLEAVLTVALHRGRRGVVCLRVERSGAIELRNARGDRRAGALRDGSFVAPWLTIVRWRPEHARFDRTVPILPDMLDAHAFRRLRVLLKWR